MCLVGEPKSGQTSLFTPISRLIPARYIAMITTRKVFNKSLVDENTQIIFLDEAHANLMDPDDWKILTQGGLVTPQNVTIDEKCNINAKCNNF